MELFKSLAVGFATGFIFSLFKLPIPAPQVWAGVVGIVGILLGYMAAKHL